MARSPRTDSALGPRGRGLFERLFGARSTPAQAIEHREAPVISIASGKGGTGKSFLATSLALLLDRAEKRVTLVDCDFGLACDHLLLGVTPTHTLQHVLARQMTIDQVKLKTPNGPTLIPGASGVRQMATLNDRELAVLGDTLGDLAGDCDVMLLDVGAGIAAQTMLTLACADYVVLVTQSEIAALTDAYAIIKTLAQFGNGNRIGVVVNRVHAPGQGERTFDKLATVAKNHTGTELQFLGEVPDEPAVAQRRLGQQPLLLADPEGPIAKAMLAITDRLREVAGPFEPRVVEPDQTVVERYRSHRLFLF